jgi:hypothetical protein
MLPNDVRRRPVDEVPVIRASGIPQVELKNPVPLSIIAPLVLRDQNLQADGAVLVNRRCEQPFNIRERKMAMPKRNAPLERDGYAEKAIAFSVLALASLEEPRGRRRALSTSNGLQFADNIPPARSFPREFVVFRPHAEPVQGKPS